MGKQTKPEDRPFRKIAETLITSIFTEAKRSGEDLSPDKALLRMWEQLRVVFPTSGGVSDSAKRATRRSLKSDIARQKKIHLFAVEQFYKTYFPAESGRGRPKLPDEDRQEPKHLRESGLRWGKVAEAQGDQLAKGGGDKYRKRAKG